MSLWIGTMLCCSCILYLCRKQLKLLCSVYVSLRVQQRPSMLYYKDRIERIGVFNRTTILSWLGFISTDDRNSSSFDDFSSFKVRLFILQNLVCALISWEPLHKWFWKLRSSLLHWMSPSWRRVISALSQRQPPEKYETFNLESRRKILQYLLKYCCLIYFLMTWSLSLSSLNLATQGESRLSTATVEPQNWTANMSIDSR